MSNIPDKKFIVQLDQPREIKWTNRALARFDSLGRRANFTALSKGGRGGFYALCAILWAALVDHDHGFEEPEDLANHLKGPAEQKAALAAVVGMITAANPPEAKAKNGDGSTSGPGASSSSDAPPPTGGA